VHHCCNYTFVKCWVVHTVYWQWVEWLSAGCRVQGLVELISFSVRITAVCHWRHGVMVVMIVKIDLMKQTVVSITASPSFLPASAPISASASSAVCFVCALCTSHSNVRTLIDAKKKTITTAISANYQRQKVMSFSSYRHSFYPDSQFYSRIVFLNVLYWPE